MHPHPTRFKLSWSFTLAMSPRRPNLYPQNTVPKHRDRKAHVVTYADDFVIPSRRKADRALNWSSLTDWPRGTEGRPSDSDAARTCIRTLKAGPGKTPSPEFPSKEAGGVSFGTVARGQQAGKLLNP